jgi:hypothetical protein
MHNKASAIMINYEIHIIFFYSFTQIFSLAITKKIYAKKI